MTSYAAVLALVLGGCGTRPGGGSTAGNAPDSSLRASPVHAAASPEPAPPTQLRLQVAAQSQLPQLPNGCEVTSLSMLLSAVGRPVDKLELAARQPRDSTPVTYRAGSSSRDLDQVVIWGNPDIGFVGDPAGSGYGIYHAPLTRLLNQYLPGRAADLTGQSIDALQIQLAHGLPTVAWVTTTLQPVNDWVSWQSPSGPVRATRYEHAVLVVGYDATNIYINNPLTGEASLQVPRDKFLAVWQQLGNQAVSVATPSPSRS